MPNNGPPTEFELFQALRQLYPASEYALLPQVANGTGASAKRHADALAISLWPSRGLHLSGFEIKSYRGDWIRELKSPQKAEPIARFCNFWWIVAGGPFIKVDELPALWGLLTWDEKSKSLIKTKAAHVRDADTPDIPFVAAMLRKAQEVVGPEATMIAAREESFASGKRAGEEAASWELKELRKLRETVGQFEKASGVKVTRWEGGEKIGAAVEQVLSGSVNRYRESLLATARDIIKDLEGGK